MKLLFSFIFLASVFTIFSAAYPSNKDSVSEPKGEAESYNDVYDVTIFADVSMTIPITQIARQYSSEKQLSVSAVFSSTKDQVEKIEDGKEANLIISAKPFWIKRLQQQGLIDVYSKTNIVANSMVIAGSNQNQKENEPGIINMKNIKNILPLMADDFNFALGDPEYLAEGTYGFEAIGNIGISGDLEPHFSIFRNSYSMLNSTRNHGAYSAVFKTDAILYPDLYIAATFPENSYSPIIYQAAVVAGENMDGARDFLKYLRSDSAQAVFSHYGFDLIQK